MRCACAQRVLLVPLGEQTAGVALVRHRTRESERSAAQLHPLSVIEKAVSEGRWRHAQQADLIAVEVDRRVVPGIIFEDFVVTQVGGDQLIAEESDGTCRQR